MPSKLGREKGQHLRPFLLTVLANTLYAQEKVDYKEKIETSDSRFGCLAVLKGIGDASFHFYYF